MIARMGEPATAAAFDAFDALPDPAAILAADGSLLRANAAFRETFRHWVGPQRPPWGRAATPAFIDGMRRFDATAPDGRHFEWVERQQADGVRLVVARDVTLHVRAAEDALRAKTTLFATLTHELRTPLNGILGMASLLDLGKLEPSAQSYVGAIKQSGEHLLELITEILDYSRLEAGRIALDSVPFDPEATMQDVAELLSPKARGKDLEIAVTVRSSAPTRVIGDDGRLRQILFNLAGNAVKFTESGGVVLEMSPRPGGRLRFSVRDTGLGVAPEKQTLIFEEFTQADASVSRRHGGTGLGLAIVKRLALAMGGEAGLFSKPGYGATFWVEIPFGAVADAPAPLTLSGARVALITPSHVLAQSIRAMIASLNGVVVERDEQPDVILLDWHEGADGETINAMKRGARAVIALIAQENREAIPLARAAGIVHYTLKPLRRRSLVERIRVSLGETITVAAGEAPRADEAAPGILTGLRVLLAEDNPINALLARKFLTCAGCIVVGAQDGEEAVAAAAAAAFDLILLDIRMPRIDGIEAAERIRAGAGPSARAPIVALTADTGDAERTRAMRAGMDDFITKPIDAHRLLAVAERFIPRAD
ncbi:MAG: response regulator [Vitreimonas sp.]